MYATDTILTLKEQRPNDPETDEPFPYNQVRVVGESPINHVHGDWSGTDAAGVIVQPVTNFGATLDEPFGKLRALYDVESIPEPPEITQTSVRVIDSRSAQAGPTPEEVFEAKAPGAPPEEGQTRARTPRPSPLGQVKDEAAAGPLGDVAPLDPPRRTDLNEGANPSPLDPVVTE
jgi:hypothetical protein